jgi:ribosome biogenesis protein BMS1
MGNISKWKESLMKRTVARQNINLMELVYGKSTSTSTTTMDKVQDSSDDEESDGEEFFKPKGEGKKVYP